MMNKQRFQNGDRSRSLTRRILLGSMAATAGSLALIGCSTKKSGRSQSGSSQATKTTNETRQAGGTLNIVAEGNAATLDPHKTSTSVVSIELGAVMSRLFRSQTGPDPKTVFDHNLENDLAIHSESPDAVTWTFKLHPQAKFHDAPPVNGHAVEAEDVKTTFTRALTIPGNPSRALLGMIDPAQIQTPASDTVVFKLKFPYAHFAHLMSSATFAWILPREALAGSYDPGKQVIGSGPFLFESYTPDVGFIMKKNPSWFEKGRPYIDGIHSAIVPDAAQRLAQFVAGNLDDVAPDPNDIATVQRQAPQAMIVTGGTTGGGGYPLYMQLGDPTSPFQDIRVRRALSLAIDRKAIGSAVYNNHYEPTFFVAPGYGKWALKPNEVDQSVLQYYTFDPAGAKKLLADAGQSNLAIKLEYTTGASEKGSAFRAQIEAINNMLNNAGIKSTLAPIDQLAYEGGGKGPRYGFYDKDTIMYTGVTALEDVDELLFQYFNSQSPSVTRLHDATLDEMLAKARTVLDENESVKAYKDIQKYIADKMYVVGGFAQGNSYEAVQPRVQGYNYSNTHGVLTETYAKVWLKG